MADHSFWKNFTCTIQPESIQISQVESLLQETRVPESTKAFLIPISIEPIDWLFARSVFYAKKKGIELSTCGFKVHNEYIIFAHDFTENKVTVLTLHTNQSLDILLSACINECLKYQLEKLEIWDFETDHVACVANERSLSLSSLAVFSGDSITCWKNNDKVFWV